MKKKPFNSDKKDRLDPMKDTRNYAAGSEGEDILDPEDEDAEIEEEVIIEEEELPDDNDLELLEDEEDFDNDDDEDDDRA